MEILLLPEGISVATENDAATIASVINTSFKGDAGDGNGAGWSNLSAIFKDNPRMSEEQARRQMMEPNCVFLKYTCEDGIVGGCLYLKDMGNKKYELWSMSVIPERQSQGIGRKLLDASSVYAKGNGYKIIELGTPSNRPEVLSWYQRCGFTNTGKIIDFDWSSVTPKPLPVKIISPVTIFIKYL